MSIRDRLRLVFRRDRPVERDEPAPEPYRHAPEVEFVAYAEDCRLYGHVRLHTERLTDLLNEHEQIELVDVAMEGLDGRIFEVRTIVVSRDELLAVHASGPRGVRNRRLRTRPHPVAVQTGPFHVRGHLHAMPTADPFAALRRRPPFVPLTDGSIAYSLAGVPVLRRSETIIVNRELWDWIAPATDEEIEFPELPVTQDRSPMLKDFTGNIHVEPVIPIDEPAGADGTPVPAPALPADGGAAPVEREVRLREAS